MFDRLLMNKWWLIAILLGYCQHASSQSSAFQFSYPGPDTIAVGVNCQAILQGTIGTPQVSSSIGAAITQSVFDAASSGFLLTDITPNNTTRIVHWLVSDNQGNSHVFTFPVTTRDRTAPNINSSGVPAVVTYGSTSQIPPAPALTASDNCTSATAISISFSETAHPPICAAGSVTRTWTASDLSGNTSQFIQTILITADQTPPTITSFPTSTFVNCNQNMQSAFQAWLGNQMSTFAANDASGTPTYSNNAPATYPSGCTQTVSVVFTATDACANTTTATAEFGTNDFIKPVITGFARDSVVYCDGNPIPALNDWIKRHGRATATDNCTPQSQLRWTMSINGTSVDSVGVIAALQQSMTLGCSPKTVGGQVYMRVQGVIDVDFYVADLCNNIEHAEKASFGVIDTTPPQLIPPAPTIQPCLGANNPNAISGWIQQHGNVTATDFCGPVIWSNTYRYTTSDGMAGQSTVLSGPHPTPPLGLCQWYMDATFYASDHCGNQDSITVRYTMNDKIGPNFLALPTQDTFPCQTGIPQNYTTPVTDACTGPVTPSYTLTQIGSPCAGTQIYQVDWLATDACGNSTTAVSHVVVIDRQAPKFAVVPPDITIECTSFALPPDPIGTPALVVTDFCGGTPVVTSDTTNTRNPNPATCGYSNYTIRRQFIAIDACGNRAVVTQIITVRDTMGPHFMGFVDTLVNCSAIADPLNVNFTLPTARDACNNISYPISLVDRQVTAGTCADNYDLRIRWQATDACQNTAYFTQLVRARDTIPPGLTGIPANITVDCLNIPNAPTLGNGITAADNCDNAVTVLFNQTEIRVPDPTQCAHYAYDLKREWVATDNCGNVKGYTQIITVRDSTPPVLICHPNVVVPALPGQCFAQTNIPIPNAIYDACSSTPTAAVLQDSLPIVNTSGLPNNNAVVDPLRFVLPAPNFSDTWPASTQATLRIDIKRADAEQPDEHFKVFGERNTFLGITSPVSGQCGDGTTLLFISQERLNDWLMDGNLEITLIPNGNGATAINAICLGGGKVILKVDYTYVKPNLPLTVTYKINQQAEQPFPPSSNVTLSSGINTITYTATDCFGNKSTCALEVNILDVEAPLLGAVSTTRAWVPSNNCMAQATLSAPISYSDNCSLGTNYAQASDINSTVFQSDPNAGNIPADINYTFLSTPSNIIGNGVFTFQYLGDIAEAGEFFTVLSENGSIIGTTSLVQVDSQCLAWKSTNFTIQADSLRVWAEDGRIKFRLVANNDAGSFTDFIHPCGALNAQMIDGISRWQLRLKYTYADFNYTIKDTAGVTVATGNLVNKVGYTSLPAGAYTVEYAIADPSANIGSRTGQILIFDTIAPIASCKNALVPVDIGGNGTFTLTPAQVDLQSRDNCGIKTMTLSQTLFSCGQSGNNIPVTLTVTDHAGNTSQCTSTVQIQTTGISPNYLSGICANQELRLFSNPTNDPTQTFTYNWSGPNNFSSQAANPIIPMAGPNNAGTYSLIATNINGCSTTANLFVTITNLPPAPTVQANKSSFCAGEQIILTTQTYGSSNVSYAWFTGSPGQSTLITTTTSPQLIIPSALQGQTNYYVIATVNNCASPPSAPITVIVNQIPAASVTQQSLRVCAGEPITLVPAQINPTHSYSWTGPNFSASAPQPTVTPNASSIHAGDYQLVVNANGCSSLPSMVRVEVTPRPQQPILSANTPLCLGQQIEFNTTATGVNHYWLITPLQDTIQSSVAQIRVPSLQHTTGAWQLYVTQNGCASQTSPPLQVVIESSPSITAVANSPVCTNDVLKLQAQSVTNGLNYRWTGPNGFVSLLQNPITNPITGRYVVFATTPLAGCAATDTINVTAVQNPIITSVSSNAPLCATGTTSATLEAVVFPPNPNYNYNWRGPNSFVSTNVQPIIPNLSSANAGQYLLVVTDQFGCASDPKSTTITTTNAPALPIITPVNTLCAGANLEILIQNATAYQGSQVNYIWHTPTGGTISTQSPSLQKNNIGTSDAGLYWVEVMSGSCVSLPSAQINVLVNPIPPTPVVLANPILCEGDTLKLQTNITTGDVWQWTGPGGFTSNLRNPVIAQVNPFLHAGEYYVSYVSQGCRSRVSDPLDLTIRNRPLQPVLNQPAPVCIADPNSKLTLQIVPSTTTPNAGYTFYRQSTNTQIGMTTFNNQLVLDSLTSYGYGSIGFYVQAQADGCKSLPSAPVIVGFDTIPNQIAYAGPDFAACVSGVISLNAAPVQIGSGAWSQIAGQFATISTPTQPNSTIVNTSAGQNYTFVWSLNNGGCINYSRDTVVLQVRAFEAAQSTPVIDSCFVFSAQLSAKVPISGATGFWTQPSSQTVLGVQIAEINNPNTLVTGLEPGNIYQFYWNLPDIGCGIATDTTLVRSIGSLAFAEPDRTLCTSDSCDVIRATALTNLETGVWTSLTPSVRIITANQNETAICNLQRGNNVFVWTTNDGKCGDRSRDTLTVRFELQPILKQDTIAVPYGSRIEFSTLVNDKYPTNFKESQLTAPESGKLERLGPGLYRYTPELGQENQQFFTYQVCNLNCADSCPTQIVLLNVQEQGDCIVPTVITPNDDKVNDTFYLPCFDGDGFENSEVTIFNANGQQVFYASPYLNNFKGIGTDGRLLSVGTYYYIVNFNNGKDETKRGFLEISR